MSGRAARGAYNANVRQLDDSSGRSGVVDGPRAGPIGLLCARMAALAGANPLIVVGLASDAPRLETAMRLGRRALSVPGDAGCEKLGGHRPRAHPLGADSCARVGREPPAQSCAGAHAPDGQVTKVGWSPDLLPVNINPLVQKNVRLQGSFSHNFPIVGTRDPSARPPPDASGCDRRVDITTRGMARGIRGDCTTGA